MVYVHKQTNEKCSWKSIRNNQKLYSTLTHIYISIKSYSFIIHNIPKSWLDLHLLRTTLEITQSRQICFNLLLLKQSKWFVPTHNSNLHAARLHLSLITCWFLQCSQTMQHKFIHVWCFEWSEVIFEIGSGWLRSSSNGVGIVLIVISTWTGFKEMRSIFIHSCHKQSHSIWSFGGFLCFNLWF